MNSLRPIGLSGLIRRADNPEIIFELRPNLNAMFKLAEVKTNSQGLRDKEYSKSKPSGTFRIAFVGDSFTMPSGVKLEDAFHTIIEKRLNSLGTRKFEAINFGVPGYTLRQYAAVLENKVPEYNPDLVIIGFCPKNDKRIYKEKRYDGTFEPKAAIYPAFTRSYTWLTLQGGIRRLRRIFLGEERSRKTISPPSESESRYIEGIFSRMKMFSARQNIPIVIVYLDYIQNKEYVEQLKQLAERSGLLFADTSFAFHAGELESYKIFMSEYHPNAKANKVFSDVLLSYMQNKNLLIDKSTNLRQDQEPPHQ
jgi:hypothetical protein